MLSETGNRSGLGIVLERLCIGQYPKGSPALGLAGFLLYSYDTESEILMCQFY